MAEMSASMGEGMQLRQSLMDEILEIGGIVERDARSPGGGRSRGAASQAPEHEPGAVGGCRHRGGKDGREEGPGQAQGDGGSGSSCEWSCGPTAAGVALP